MIEVCVSKYRRCFLDKFDRKFYFLMGVGLELTGVIIVSLYLGQFIDHKYSLGGVGLAFFSMLGFLGWIVHLVFLVKKFDNNKDS